MPRTTHAVVDLSHHNRTLDFATAAWADLIGAIHKAPLNKALGLGPL